MHVLNDLGGMALQSPATIDSGLAYRNREVPVNTRDGKTEPSVIQWLHNQRGYAGCFMTSRSDSLQKKQRLSGRESRHPHGRIRLSRSKLFHHNTTSREKLSQEVKSKASNKAQSAARPKPLTTFPFIKKTLDLERRTEVLARPRGDSKGP